MGPRNEESPGKFSGVVILDSYAVLLRFISQSRAVIGTTGGWRDPYQMEKAVENGDVDMIGLGRPLREDPELVNSILGGSARTIKL